MSKSFIIDRAKKLADEISLKRKAIVNLLLDYESYETATDEINRSLRCLNNIKTELKYLSCKKVNSISVFFPLNLPLYSLVLFAVIPSLMTESVFVRPPLLMRRILKEIYGLLEINKIFPIKIFEIEKRLFIDGYASVSDVIIFIGRYHNALEARK